MTNELEKLINTILNLTENKNGKTEIGAGMLRELKQQALIVKNK